MLLSLPLALAALAAPPAPAAAPPPLNGDKGPLRRRFGGTDWLVFGCEDKATLVVWADKGNPAAPFYFLLYPHGEERRLYGEGTGDRKATAPAFEALKRLDPEATARLLAEAEQAGATAAEPAPGPVPPTRARLRRPSLFADLDYPPAAIRAGEEGAVEFELGIGADGRVESCTILVSSGSAILDSETCRMIRARARLTPARDAEGRPTPDRLRGRTEWRLPR